MGTGKPSTTCLRQLRERAVHLVREQESEHMPQAATLRLWARQAERDHGQRPP